MKEPTLICFEFISEKVAFLYVDKTFDILLESSWTMKKVLDIHFLYSEIVDIQLRIQKVWLYFCSTEVLQYLVSKRWKKTYFFREIGFSVYPCFWYDNSWESETFIKLHSFSMIFSVAFLFPFEWQANAKENNALRMTNSFPINMLLVAV